MKKILIVAFGLMIFVHHAYAVVSKNNTYCVIDYSGGGTCYWCTAGGTTPAGDCKQGYAGCMSNPEKYISVGGTVGEYKCSNAGFCKTRCDGTGYWGLLEDIDYKDAPGAEVYFEQSGCDCTEYRANTLMVRCAAGWYGVPDRHVYTGCQKCPSVMDENGEIVYGASMPGMNENITDCFLIAGGIYSDDTGIYTIDGDICRYLSDPQLPVPQA